MELREFNDIVAGHLTRDIHNSHQEWENQFQHQSLNIVDEAATTTMNMFQRQYTWSPCSYCPGAEEFSKYLYGTKTGADGRLKTLRFNVVKEESKRRRLSSLFSPNRNLQHEERSLHPNVEVTPRESNPPSSSVVSGRKKTFIVTPCTLDNVK